MSSYQFASVERAGGANVITADVVYVIHFMLPTFSGVEGIRRLNTTPQAQACVGGWLTVGQMLLVGASAAKYALDMQLPVAANIPRASRVAPSASPHFFFGLGCSGPPSHRSAYIPENHTFVIRVLNTVMALPQVFAFKT
ncbi:hypothetical protein C8J57DRAFT_1240259 [Mycena rebaudengoi]|nr:hypothetical protein C8J57DRAFT_1240259 [Mycena rebaudengoi]